MDYSRTKINGDISEQMVALKLTRLGCDVSIPIGDRLPYDLIADVNGNLSRVQVKTAWYNNKSGNYTCDTRKSRTNQHKVGKVLYGIDDFDFAIAVIQELDTYYVFPVNVFLGYASTIDMVEQSKRQRPPRSLDYRERWDLLLNWTRQGEIPGGISVKLGEACSDGNPEPSSTNVEKV